MKLKLFLVLAAIFSLALVYASISGKLTTTKEGAIIDSLNGVYVYYNGDMNNTFGRNEADDGYNLGLKYQCVEFVKRYYYQYLHHKMPNTWGHAKDFYSVKYRDGQLNTDRGLLQFTNGSKSKPKVHDLIIFDGGAFNPYGHVAIVSKVGDDFIEITQQNVGNNSRQNLDLNIAKGLFFINSSDCLGWLRIP